MVIQPANLGGMDGRERGGIVRGRAGRKGLTQRKGGSDTQNSSKEKARGGIWRHQLEKPAALGAKPLRFSGSM